MAETAKIRVKIGAHEFEAEGPSADVNAQFEAWRSLIASLAAAKPPSGDPLRSAAGKKASPNGERLAPFGDYSDDLDDESGESDYLDIFAIDDKRKIVTLRAHPTGDTRDADAVLLLMYGFRRLLESDDVMVGRLKDAVQTSGINVERVDRTVDSYMGSYLLKTGRGPGGKYRLTNTGLARAQAMAQEMWQQFAK